MIKQYNISVPANKKLKDIKSLVQKINRFLPKFIESSDYMSWDFSIQMAYDYLSQNIKSILEKQHYDIIYENNFESKDKLYHQCLKHIHPRCLSDVISSSYLYSFVRAVENLTLGVTLCSVVKENDSSTFQFPIIYINEVYSLITGVDRKELLGVNFTDINIDTNGGSDGCYSCLQNAKPYITKIYNKHGESGDMAFEQLIGIRPLLDANGIYSYVIILHVDETNASEINQNDEMLYKLLLKLPKKLNPLELPLIKEQW